MATQDGETFKDKIEISLDGKQLFLLFFGGAVITGLVFVLGVMVGKRVEARAQDRPSTSAHDPLAALDQLDREADQLTFSSALRGENVPDPLADSLGAVPAGKVVDSDPANKPDEKAAPKEGGSEAEELAQKKEEAAKAELAKAEQAKSEQAKAELAKQTADKVALAKAAVPAKPDKNEKIDKMDKNDPKARYTLQLSSFQTQADADAFAAQIRKAGYSPFIISAEVDGKGMWYRVRLGSYATFDDAVAAKKQFEDKQRIIAYVSKL